MYFLFNNKKHHMSMFYDDQFFDKGWSIIICLKYIII